MRDNRTDHGDEGTAKALKAEDAKKWTHAMIATALGVGQDTVSDWMREDISNMATHKANTDARVSVPKSLLPDLVARVESGEWSKSFEDLQLSSKSSFLEDDGTND